MLGIYLRVSTEKQRDNYSLPEQERMGKAFANGQPYRLYKEAQSGKDIIARTELRRLLTDIEKSEITKVWVANSSRLARDAEDAKIIKRLFIQHNVKISVNGIEYDLSNLQSALFYNVTATFDEYNRGDIVAKATAGTRARIDDGRQTFPVLYGYKFVYSANGEKTCEVVEEEAKVVRQIYDFYREGKSQYWLASSILPRSPREYGKLAKERQVGPGMSYGCCQSGQERRLATKSTLK